MTEAVMGGRPPLHPGAACRASFLAAHRVAKAKEPLSTEEGLTLPAAEVVCCKILGEAPILKVQVSLVQVELRLERLME